MTTSTVLMHYGMIALVTAAVVVSIQAVGVILVSAMLVTPAATALLLTRRLSLAVAIAAMLGAVAGVGGAILSLADANLPTGAIMVLVAGTLFALAALLAPQAGLLPRIRRRHVRTRRTQVENLLLSMYRMMEARGGEDRRFGLSDIAATRQYPEHQARRMAADARRRGWIDGACRDPLVLTDAGLDEARRLMRNHRLWELFLTQEASLAPDHVHADAEHIEHLLDAPTLARLEALLDNPTADPHGRPIPQAGARA